MKWFDYLRKRKVDDRWCSEGGVYAGWWQSAGRPDAGREANAANVSTRRQRRSITAELRLRHRSMPRTTRIDIHNVTWRRRSHDRDGRHRCTHIGQIDPTDKRSTNKHGTRAASVTSRRSKQRSSVMPLWLLLRACQRRCADFGFADADPHQFGRPRTWIHGTLKLQIWNCYWSPNSL